MRDDDSIVSDADVLRTCFSTAFYNVAVADAEDVFEFLQVVEVIRWMHHQKYDAEEESRTDKLPDLLITHHTTDILAEEELDTFVEFLNVFYVFLLHPVSIVARYFGFSGRMHWLIS